MLASIGGLLYCVIDDSNDIVDETWYKYVMYLMLIMGQYGTCINTALLGVALYMITSHTTKFVLNISIYLNLAGAILPFLVCGIILTIQRDEIFKDGIGSYPVFSFEYEYYVVIGLLSICTLVTLVSLIITQRQYKKSRVFKGEPINEETNISSEMEAKLAKILPEMDIKNCNECQWDNKEIVCRFKASKSLHIYNHNCQIIRHSVLLINLTFCMLAGKLLQVITIFLKLLLLN